MHERTCRYFVATPVVISNPTLVVRQPTVLENSDEMQRSRLPAIPPPRIRTPLSAAPTPGPHRQWLIEDPDVYISPFAAVPQPARPSQPAAVDWSDDDAILGDRNRQMPPLPSEERASKPKKQKKKVTEDHVPRNRKKKRKVTDEPALTSKKKRRVADEYESTPQKLKLNIARR
jgi:hypothetical protein